MKERIFIQKAKEHTNMEEFLRSHFSQAKCGSIEVQHTPIMTRIIIHTSTPGLVIGSGGERIKETIEVLKDRFNLENPQIDVQKIDNPNLDSHIVAQTIASALEGGVNYKRLGNYYLSKVMESGAVGCEIIFAGKLSGERSRKQRFPAGYIKKCGEPSETDVMTGFAVANPKLGNIGVTVKIMLKQPKKLELKGEEEERKEEESKEEDKTEKKEEEVKKKAKEEVKPKEEKKEVKEESKVETKKEALALPKEEKKKAEASPLPKKKSS